MNVQQTITSGIKELLFFNNYLVLPGFGGFVLKNKPAHISHSGTTLFAAAKLVSFNSQLKQNDGILTTWLQNKLECTPSQAYEHLTDFSEYCQSVLTTRRRFTLNNIGFFYLDFENNICFEPQADINFMPESFGLAPLTIKKIEPLTETEKPKNEPIFKDRILTQTSTAPNIAPAPLTSKRNYRRLITPILLATLLLSTLSLLVLNNRISGTLKSSFLNSGKRTEFAPIAYPNLQLIKNQKTQTAYVADANGIASLALDNAKTIAVLALEDKNKILSNNSVVSKPSNSKMGFEIVFGCFSVPANAQRMINQLAKKNISAIISNQKHKGMSVVCTGKYSSKQEAIESLLSIKENYPNAWIK